MVSHPTCPSAESPCLWGCHNTSHKGHLLQPIQKKI
uniref:Uncharacterized protein n=1 Tax=Rhizophora mucronata TaxID=61149 RepID=A0A2P2Q2K4_RHIMU